MKKRQETSITSHFTSIKDPRIDRQKRHKLIDIFVIAICAVICGADEWVSIEMFGKSKYKWFKQFLELSNGIPSHDIFGRVFSQLLPQEIKRCFLSWIEAIADITEGEIIPVDGKTLRRSYSNEDGKAAIHMVSAWASQNNLILGQIKTAEKSNEITAIPKLLNILEISGCIITIDAMGCQKEIASKILQKGADYSCSKIKCPPLKFSNDFVYVRQYTALSHLNGHFISDRLYVLALKGNQQSLYEDASLFLDDIEKKALKNISYDFEKTVEKNHGRIEIRKYWITSDTDWLNERHSWEGLRSIGMVEATRTVNGYTSTERRYYICSIAANAKLFAKAVRSHWSIENSCHWVLDMAFREDESRIRKDHSPENFAFLRHIVLNMLKNETSAKV